MQLPFADLSMFPPARRINTNRRELILHPSGEGASPVVHMAVNLQCQRTGQDKAVDLEHRSSRQLG